MKKIFIYIIFLITLAACKEKYIAPVQSPPTGYLVVEGFINSGQGATSITLTRTTRLYDTADIISEHNATVSVEGENNENFPLYENGNGVYVSPSSLSLNNNEKYRLKIKTQDNKEYASDFSTVKHTPDIDSVNWKPENGGLNFFIQTHDPQNNTRYYRWDYEETWEFHSIDYSTLVYVVNPSNGKIRGVDYWDPVGHSADSSIYKCWRTNISRNINIGTSEKLSADVIYLPLFSIEPGSQKLSVLYSLLVKQYALSQDEYLFYGKIKKNTEQLGSIFDPQPSELQGNIHCLTVPAETVVGYVGVSEEKDLRIFISSDDVPGWNYQSGCYRVVVPNDGDSIEKNAPGSLPIQPESALLSTILTFYASDATCVNCTLTGTNIKPSFWP